jgi:hypothetical protein
MGIFEFICHSHSLGTHSLIYLPPYLCLNLPLVASLLFQLFVSIRSDVSGHLYDDVIPCLKFLTKEIGVRVAVLTNGNANLTSCTVLGEYVTLSLGTIKKIP